MSDASSTPLPEEAARPDEYPMNPDTAIPSLAALLRERIHREGPMGFAEFMEAALYEPALGYYARGTRQVGRGGDFFTSVSVGPLFGQLLARRFIRQWHESGSPTRWRVIECGAHDGSLAADILGALLNLEPVAFAALEYAIPEPLASLQAAQRETLKNFGHRVRFVAHSDELATEPLPGIAFGNEVLDALPCHLVEMCQGRWLEMVVDVGSADRLVFKTQGIRDIALVKAIEPLGGCFPESYRTEVRTCYGGYLAPLARALSSGLMIWVDYGFSRPDYYHPARTEGTLRTFSKHRAGDDPLVEPGSADITAHVDFTAVVEAAETLGWRQTLLRDQGRWLTEIGRDWLLEMEGNPQPAALRQFQTLMHPAHLGAKFHALELSRG
jgi:SAM-dependent MidA family methyltransferase